MMSALDLHIHSEFSSDGEFSPEHIVARGRAKGLKVMSITDHNSIKGVIPALKAARSCGITLIPGIEIDCVFRNLNLHVLGYGVNSEDPAFSEIERFASEQEMVVFTQMIIQLQKMGFYIDENEVLKVSPMRIPSPEFVGEVLLSNSENQNDSRLLPYRKGGKRNDMPYFNFYRDFCSPGKPAYVKTYHPGLSAIVDIIHKTGGVSILAHPGSSLLTPEEYLDPILETGLDGIEVFSSYHSPDDSKYYLTKAVESGVYITCGSDFHGKNKPTVELGGVGSEGYECFILDSIRHITQS